MGIAIQCILEQPIIGLPDMEGKLLCAAFCSDPGGDDTNEDNGPATNLVAVDFGRTMPPRSDQGAGESLFGPLGQFITGDSGIAWHDPSEGLAVVQGILAKLRSGAQVALDPDFNFFGDNEEEEVTEGVIDDLETLQEILTAARNQQIGFRLIIDA